jgi:hypothetical protein
MYIFTIIVSISIVILEYLFFVISDLKFMRSSYFDEIPKEKKRFGYLILNIFSDFTNLNFSKTNIIT